MTGRLHSLSNLLGGECDDNLQRLIARAGQLERLNVRLLDRLGSPAKHHIRLANIRDGVAYLQADSPAWLARLRYMKPQIHTALTELGIVTQGIDLSCLSAAAPLDNKPAPTREIPDDARLLLRDFAEQQQDPALRKALLRLSEARKKVPG